MCYRLRENLVPPCELLQGCQQTLPQEFDTRCTQAVTAGACRAVAGTGSTKGHTSTAAALRKIPLLCRSSLSLCTATATSRTGWKRTRAGD